MFYGLKLKENMMNGIPEFYKEVVKAWGDLESMLFVCLLARKRF